MGSICVQTLLVNDDLDHDKIVCPPILKAGAFTTAVINDIDHYPSSNTATSSFDGTAISLSQHPSLGKGRERKVPDFQIKEKEIEKFVTLLHIHKVGELEITTQKPNGLKDTPKRYTKYKNK